MIDGGIDRINKLDQGAGFADKLVKEAEKTMKLSKTRTG